MTESFITVPRAIDPHLRRWMLFVDGENFTIRAQKVAKDNSLALIEGPHYSPDVFVWVPNVRATIALTNGEGAFVPVQPHAIRAHYYTSATGDEPFINKTREALWDLGFHPEVFKKQRKDQKAKGVDIALAKDLLCHAFFGNYEVAVLMAGDADYVPLVNEIKRQGRVVYLAFFRNSGLAPALRLACDAFFDWTQFFLDQWRK